MRRPSSWRRNATAVLVVTDPFHEDRSMAIASDLGLTPSPDAHPDLTDHRLVDRARTS